MNLSVKKIIYTCLFIIILIAGLAFFLRNSQVQEFNYLIGTITLPLALLVLLSLFAGVICGLLAVIPLLLRQRRRIARLEKQALIAEKEINNLRIVPVKDMR